MQKCALAHTDKMPLNFAGNAHTPRVTAFLWLLFAQAHLCSILSCKSMNYDVTIKVKNSLMSDV